MTHSGEPTGTLCIIPARGGSKGIPVKNMVDFCGRPLLAWTMMQALAAEAVDHVVVSSDHPAILEAARAAGCIAIHRPPELSTDTASSESAIAHVLEQCPAHGICAPEVVVFLQATSPLRTPADIDSAMAQWRSDQCDSLFSGSRADDFCLWDRKAEGPLESITYDADRRGRRQDRPHRYLENGSIYVFSASGFQRTGNRLHGTIGVYDMPLWQSFEIDTIDDLDLCRDLFQNRLLPIWSKPPARGIAVDDIGLIVYDFDGVMTDNRAVLMEDGREGVWVNRSDGMGVGRLKRLGIPQLIMSTESNPVVHARGEKLGIETHAPVADKAAALAAVCRQRGIAPQRVIFVGNDLNDAEAMAMVGFPVAPADAHPDIRAMACIVTKAGGGAGVIRELADGILAGGDHRAQNRSRP